MRKINWLKSYQLRTTGVAVATAIFLTACASTPQIPAPTEQMAVSRAAINTASSAGGSEFAPVQLKSAIEKMDGAEHAMGAKNYGLARQLAEEAQVDAQLASAAAQAGKAQQAANALHEGDHVLRKEMDRKTNQ